MKKLTPKAEVFDILVEAGKPPQEAYIIAGYEGNPKGSNPYTLKQRVKSYKLTEPEYLDKAQKITKSILAVAAKALKKRKNDPEIQELCIKYAAQFIQDQQDKIDPKRNLNYNANLNIDAAKLQGFDPEMFDVKP